MNTPQQNDKDLMEIHLKAGETYYFCTCGRSAGLPFCDGAHKGTGIKSLQISPKADITLEVRPLAHKAEMLPPRS